ncbi:MAG: mitochondrial grpE-type co-chaperone of the HSP70 system [Monoraphidium minutum]|nr:MAG: mitochondrial grpE-type co-chaperone of the HSP70 system [Monoraphidium minutum]
MQRSASGVLRLAAAPASAAVQRTWQEPWAPPLLRAHAAGYADSAGPGGGKQEQQHAGAPAGDGAAEGAGTSGSEGEDALSVEQLTAELQDREKAVEELQSKVNDLADSFKRSLAEMENLRQRTSRQIENAQKFAVEPIIKSLLDVADNLQRAAEAVPPSVLDGSAELEADKAQRLLKSLLQGVRMTEGVLIKVFEKHGVAQYNPEGEKFDPNLHQAMFEVPDASKEPGMVAAVTKRGYKMHERILRAAEVGVYKAP